MPDPVVVTTVSSANAPAIETPKPTPAPAATPAVEPSKAAAPATLAAKEPEKKPDGAAPWMEKKEPAKAAEPEKPKAADEKPAEVKYEFKVPEGTTVEPEDLGKFEAEMRALKVTPDLAQKLLERDLAAQKAQQERYAEELKSLDRQWLGELKASWGAKFEERSESVKRAFDFADPDHSFRDTLEKMGVANNRKLVEFVERFGDMMKESNLKAPSNVGPLAKDDRPLHERLADHYRQQAQKRQQAEKQGARR